MGYRNHEGYPDPTQGDALNGVRKEEIQRMREKQHNLKRGEIIWIKESVDTPDGKRVKKDTSNSEGTVCTLCSSGGQEWIPKMSKLLDA